MRLLAVTALLAAIFVPLAVGIVGLANGAAASDGVGLIRIFQTRTGISTLDLGQPGYSAGDELFTGNRLLTRSGKVIGYSALTCLAMGNTLSDKVSICRVVYVLPRGRIIAEGTRQRSDYYFLAVVGGTGLYAGAGGTVLASSSGPRSWRLLFSLT